MKNSIDALLNYFNKELPELKNNYKWKIPQIEGFPSCGENNYSANVELKKWFNRKWLSFDKFGDRVKLSKIVVSDWGGVRGNKDETIQSYVNEIEKVNPSFPIKGVASYSKIYSIADINNYAIYDARVAVCLNAVQWNYNKNKGLAFKYISGRNNTTGHVVKKVGFVYDDSFKIKSLVMNGWKRVKRNKTYEIYLNILKKCLRNFPDYNLYDLEMILFANAKKEALKAMKNSLQ